MEHIRNLIDREVRTLAMPSVQSLTTDSQTTNGHELSAPLPSTLAQLTQPHGASIATGDRASLAALVADRTGDRPLDGATFAEGMTLLGASLGVDYLGSSGEVTADVVKAEALMALLTSQGWTCREFVTRNREFIATCRFRGWSVAEWVEGWQRPTVHYDRSWYMEQLDADKEAGKRIGVYDDGSGRMCYGWKVECDGVLTVWKSEAQRAAALPEPKAAISEETRATLAQAKELIAVKLERDELKAKVESLTRKLRTVEMERDDALGMVARLTAEPDEREAA